MVGENLQSTVVDVVVVWNVALEGQSKVVARESDKRLIILLWKCM